MLPLLNAIYSKFTSTGALTTAFPGGMHRDQAPEGTALPYVVSHVVSSKVEYAYGGACRSDTQVKFSAYGIGHDATAALMDTLTGAFDDALLTLSTGTNDTITRLGEPTPVLHKHDGQGNDVWEWSATYEYSVRT